MCAYRSLYESLREIFYEENLFIICIFEYDQEIILQLSFIPGILRFSVLMVHERR